MNAELFSDWFHHHFVLAVKKHLTDRGLSAKALLLLDNTPAHPEATTLMSNDKSITAMFLPPNTTALIQSRSAGGNEEKIQKSYFKKIVAWRQGGKVNL